MESETNIARLPHPCAPERLSVAMDALRAGVLELYTQGSLKEIGQTTDTAGRQVTLFRDASGRHMVYHGEGEAGEVLAVIRDDTRQRTNTDLIPTVHMLVLTQSPDGTAKCQTGSFPGPTPKRILLDPAHSGQVIRTG